MIGLTLLVLLSACFNYTNLSLARSLTRVKEIGIRKVTGASPMQVFRQFILEAIIISLGSLVIGFGLFMIIKPIFLDLPNPTSQGRTMFVLDINWLQIFFILLFAITVGIVAGWLPAVFLSKMKTLNAFRQMDKSRLFSGVNIRQGLTIVQFTLSIGLIMSAVIIHKQYQYAMNYELGYQTENIVNVQIKGDYADELMNEYLAIPEVLETSRSARPIGYSTIFAMQKRRIRMNNLDS